MRMFSLFKSVVFLLSCKEKSWVGNFVLIFFENNVVSGDDGNCKTPGLRSTGGKVNRTSVGN